MTIDALKDHYERKYSHEAGQHSIGTIALTRNPVDRFQAAAHYLPPRITGGDILELGGGDGRVAKSLLAQCPQIASYVMGDLSAPRVQGVAASMGDPRVHVMEVDAERIDAAAMPRFDGIVMIALIEHLIDPISALRQLRHLLKPGGWIYLDTPNIAKYTRRLQLLRGRFPSTASRDEGLQTYDGHPVDLHDEGHLHYFTYRSLTRLLLERCGYSAVEPLSYPCGRLLLGRRLEGWLARAWPEAFSELVVVAHNGKPGATAN